MLTRDRRTIVYSQNTDDGRQLRVMGADGRGDRVLWTNFGRLLDHAAPGTDSGRRLRRPVLGLSERGLEVVAQSGGSGREAIRRLDDSRRGWAT